MAGVLTLLAEQIVNGLKPLGLNYEFLLDAYDRAAWLAGIGMTLQLSLTTLTCSLLVGVAMALLLTSGRGWLALPTRAFVELTRNTPILVQVYFAVLVINMMINLHVTGGEQHNPITAYIWVVTVLSLHYGALHAESLRGGLEAVPEAIRESSRSLGFNRLQRLAIVELPLAARFALPVLINNAINLVKSTSLAAAVAVSDVTYASLMIWSQRDNVLEIMILLLILYSVLTWFVAVTGRYVEDKVRMPGYA